MSESLLLSFYNALLYYMSYVSIYVKVESLHLSRNTANVMLK